MSYFRQWLFPAVPVAVWVAFCFAAAASQSLLVGPGNLPVGAEGLPYTVTYYASNGTGGYTWSATGLPAGLAMSPAGVLSGTPVSGSNGMYTVVATVHDSSNNTGSSSLQLQINLPTLTLIPPASLPPATVGVPYSFTFTASGNVPPYFWTIQPHGSYPVGVFFPPPSMNLGLLTGVFSGTPGNGTAGTYPIAVTVANNGATQHATMDLTFTILPSALRITLPTSLPGGAAGLPYTQVGFGATGGTGSFTWSATGLPAGLTLSSAGVLSGTPGSGSMGPYAVQVTVTDSNGATSSTTFPLNIIAAPVLSLASPPPPARELKQYAGYTLSVIPSTLQYTFTATGGFPNGMGLTTTGVVWGSPAMGSAGNYTLQMKFSDSGYGYVAYATLPFTVLPFSALAIDGPRSLNAGTEQASYLPVQFVCEGAVGTATWTATGLPAGMTISASGSLGGTPAAGSHGTYTPQFSVTDTTNSTVSLKINLVINATPVTISPATLPQGIVGVPYGPVKLTAAGGTAPYSWSYFGGLPSGLSEVAEGTIGGIPAAGSAGTYTAAFRAFDANYAFGSANLSLVIQPALSISSPASLPVATEGAYYGPVAFGAVGGAGGYGWSAAGLPAGLAMASGGTLSGTPPVGSHGSYPVQFTVRDSSGATASVSVTLTVQVVPRVTITSPLSLAACEELAVCPSQQFVASGGTPPYTWSATGLPAGLTLSTGGLLSGTPYSGSHGAYVVTVTAKDSAGLTGSTSGALALTINAPPQISGPASLSAATAGMAYGPVTFTAVYGTPPYTWSESGALPSGMAWSSGGVLSGQPVAGSAGNYPLTVQLTDSQGVSSRVQLTLTVQQPLSILSPTLLGAATETVSYGPVVFTAAGGSGSYTWSATGVPAGLTLSAGGVLSGIPAIGSNGSYSLRATVQDTSGHTAASALNLSVNAAPVGLAIGGLVPGSATAGGPAFQLLVSGTGFRSGAVVEWSGAALSTAFGSATQLTATVPGSSIGVAGTAVVTVANPDGTVSGPLTFTINPVVPFTSAAGVVNAASSLPALAPGALISIYGTNLASGSAQAPAAPLPTALGETSVSINGTAIPLLFVSPGQINAQIPYETAAGPAQMVVQSNGVSGTAVKIQVAPAGPGVMMYGAPNHVLAVNLADGSLNQASSPAVPGQYVTAYVVGQGLVSNPVATGAAAPASPFSMPVGAVQVTIGGQPATVQFAGLAPGFVGLLQLNVQIPDIAAGDAVFSVSIGGAAANDTLISVGGN